MGSGIWEERFCGWWVRRLVGGIWGIWGIWGGGGQIVTCSCGCGVYCLFLFIFIFYYLYFIPIVFILKGIHTLLHLRGSGDVDSPEIESGSLLVWWGSSTRHPGSPSGDLSWPEQPPPSFSLSLFLSLSLSRSHHPSRRSQCPPQFPGTVISPLRSTISLPIRAASCTPPTSATHGTFPPSPSSEPPLTYSMRPAPSSPPPPLSKPPNRSLRATNPASSPHQ